MALNATINCCISSGPARSMGSGSPARPTRRTRLVRSSSGRAIRRATNASGIMTAANKVIVCNSSANIDAFSLGRTSAAALIHCPFGKRAVNNTALLGVSRPAWRNRMDCQRRICGARNSNGNAATATADMRIFDSSMSPCRKNSCARSDISL